MRQIYRVMSDMLLPGIVCAALLAALGVMSLLPRLGEHMNVPGEDYTGYEDIKQTKIACDREPPKIVRIGAGNWQPGEEIPIGKVFQGTDTEGNSTEIQVLKIQDENGNSRMDCYLREEHKVIFPEKGIYLLELQSLDEQRKSVVKKFMLLIDHRQGGI